MQLWLYYDMMNFIKIITTLITISLVLLFAIKVCEARRNFQIKDLITMIFGKYRFDKDDFEIIHETAPSHPDLHQFEINQPQPQQQQQLPIYAIPFRPPTPFSEFHHQLNFMSGIPMPVPVPVPVKHVPVPVPIPQPFPVQIEKIKEVPVPMPIHQDHANFNRGLFNSALSSSSPSSSSTNELYDGLKAKWLLTGRWNEYKSRMSNKNKNNNNNNNNEDDIDDERTMGFTSNQESSSNIKEKSDTDNNNNHSNDDMQPNESKLSVIENELKEKMTQTNTTDTINDEYNRNRITTTKQTKNRYKNHNSNEAEFIEVLDDNWNYRDDADLWYLSRR